MAKQYAHSFDGSIFTGEFTTIKAALEDARLSAKDLENNMQHVHIGEVITPLIESVFPDADMITEHMACQADDVSGGFSENFPDVSKEAESQLTSKLHELLTNWCTEHQISIDYFSVKKKKKYSLETGKVKEN